MPVYRYNNCLSDFNDKATLCPDFVYFLDIDNIPKKTFQESDHGLESSR